MHPPPRDYELLEPWVRRIAMAHGVSVLVFCRHALGCTPCALSSWAGGPPPSVLRRLEAGTGVPMKRMREMTFEDAMRRVAEDLRQMIEDGVLIVPKTLGDVSGQRCFVDCI